MPQAAFADSTTAPSQHPTISFVVEALEDIHLKLTTLAASACLAIEDGDTEDNFVDGLSELFRLTLDELRNTRLWLDHDRPQMEPAQAIAKSDDPWIEAKVFWRVIEIIKAVRQESGLPVYDAEEEWPVSFLSEVKTMARGYVEQVGAKAGSWDDPLEVGSYLPWIEMVIRSDLTKQTEPVTGQADNNARGTQNSTREMRDQFIAQAHADGFSPADISMALGLRQTVVERTIRRLTREAAPETGEHEEARTA
ncbi:hypothetical protein D4A92_00280 [Rhizobium rosettiformans]|uniref:Uncharacterized protein n=1 Tax=Rhizobium rosettiformans TaxID=1368430 RepID=A0ABX7EPF3_9HYPH|nr:hypothetical protein [Rhizobium rosettiformans]QRF49989.1 hypothetical protein D4A92_00280 [Rhizobium rosettiformans]